MSRHSTRLHNYECGVNTIKWRPGKGAVYFVSAISMFVLPLFYLMLDVRVSPLYSTSPSPVQLNQVESGDVIPLGTRKLAIVLPADQPSPDLCKVISSAMALGYPAPVIVNWKEDFHTDNDGIGRSQLAKISGTLHFLDWVTSKNRDEEERLGEDDLVLMLDAYDVWLQLPPSVLLDRYFRSNAQANERIQQTYGPKANDLMHQSIIVSAQKGCVAPRDTMTNLHCDDVPESTLPTNVYGLLTDYHLMRWKFVRPRYLNSGSFMGPAGDMRRYFRRVKDKMDHYLSDLGPGHELGGDQGVFAEVFGEQEVWRQRMGYSLDNETEKSVASLHEGFEHHVGLDYTQELFYPTCYAEADGYFVSLNNSQSLQMESSRSGVSPPRINKVPADIAEAVSPLARLSIIADHAQNWAGLSLYTDFWTTTVPVALHHNAWRNGLKTRRESWWDKTWYFPYLRDLLMASIDGNQTTPIATFVTRNGSLEV